MPYVSKIFSTSIRKELKNEQHWLCSQLLSAEHVSPALGCTSANIVYYSRIIKLDCSEWTRLPALKELCICKNRVIMLKCWESSERDNSARLRGVQTEPRRRDSICKQHELLSRKLSHDNAQGECASLTGKHVQLQLQRMKRTNKRGSQL